MCTFNGGRWVAAQLRSITAGAAGIPLEIVVRDDGSADDSRHVIERCRAEGMPLRLAASGGHLGVAGNFSEAIRQCTGAVVALADQDDVWRPHKVAAIRRAFREHPAVGLVFSDADTIDARGMRLGYRLFDAIGFTRSDRRRVRRGRIRDVLLRRHVVTGATLAFRAEYTDLILPIPPAALHDAWIAAVVAAVAPVLMIEEPLIEYRQHPDQVQGEKPLSLAQQAAAAARQRPEHLIREAERCEAIRDRLVERAVGPSARWLADPWYVEQLGRKAAFLRRRAAARARPCPRWSLVAKELAAGHYRRFGHWWKTPLSDLFLDS